MGVPGGPPPAGGPYKHTDSAYSNDQRVLPKVTSDKVKKNNLRQHYLPKNCLETRMNKGSAGRKYGFLYCLGYKTFDQLSQDKLLRTNRIVSWWMWPWPSSCRTPLHNSIQIYSVIQLYTIVQ